MLVDLKVAELLCSRVCHDLVSPVGAMNAGIELLSDGGEMVGDALALVGHSAHLASNRLKFFRIAYGISGAVEGKISFTEAYDVAVAGLDERKILLEWTEATENPGGEMSKPRFKLLLNLLLLATEALPRGGNVVVARGGLVVEARGPGALLKEELVLALAADCPSDSLTVRNVQARFAALLAERLGGRVTLEAGAEGIEVAARLPPG